jgi:hypothetical protein
MEVIALVLLAVGLLGTLLSHVNVALHAYREHGPLWGFGCLLVPTAVLAWGLVYWLDDESRRQFTRYVAYAGVLAVGMVLIGL